MNVPLLRQIIATIQEEPRRLDMGTWIRPHDPISPCGTAACIAGWAVILSQERVHWIQLPQRARQLLGLSQEEADRLFVATLWPLEFRRAFFAEQGWGTRSAKAAVTVERIEHFIQTGE